MTVLPPSRVGRTLSLPPRLRGQPADDHHASAVVLLDGGRQSLREARVTVGDADAQTFVAVEDEVHREGG